MRLNRALQRLPKPLGFFLLIVHIVDGIGCFAECVVGCRLGSLLGSGSWGAREGSGRHPSGWLTRIDQRYGNPLDPIADKH